MLASALGGLSSSTLLNLLVLPALTQRCVRVQSQLQCDEDPLTGSFRPEAAIRLPTAAPVSAGAQPTQCPKVS